MDLRRSVVEKKISSRKSKSKSASRNVSNHGTDDEYDTDDNLSVTSFDSIESFSEARSEQPWTQIFDETIEALLDRKHSSAQSREESLTRLIHYMTSHVTTKTFHGREVQLTQAVCKIQRAAKTEKEIILCIRALAIIYITCPQTETLRGLIRPALTAVVNDSQYTLAKACALGAQAVVELVFQDVVEVRSLVEFLVEVIENDGNTIDAPDDGTVVAAAIDALALMFTVLQDSLQMDEVRDVSPCLVDQLESADSQVRIAAGEAIALLFELTAIDPDDDEALVQYKDHSPVQDLAYLEQKLASLSTTSSKRQSKDSRREQHSTFRDILATVSAPNSHAAPTETLKLGKTSKPGNTLYITTWLQGIRLNSLRKLLGTGLLAHLKKNGIVREILQHHGPVIDSELDSDAEPEDFSREIRHSINQELRKQRNKDRTGERKEKSSMYSSFIADDD